MTRDELWERLHVARAQVAYYRQKWMDTDGVEGKNYGAEYEKWEAYATSLEQQLNECG